MRFIAVLMVAALMGCAGAVTGPPGTASVSDINPVTGSRAGSGANSSK